MNTDIDRLVADLTPVKPLRPHDALGLVLSATALGIIWVAMRFGIRPDLLAGAPHPIVMLREGILLLLGFASLAGVVTAARPGEDQESQGWHWALAAAALFPLTSLALAMLGDGFPDADLYSPNGPWCLKISAASGFPIGGALTLWLRNGAPTALNRTGWLVGLAAGSFGAFTYGLHCPSVTVYYVGLWYSGAVALCALAGRLIVPPLIRW